MKSKKGASMTKSRTLVSAVKERRNPLQEKRFAEQNSKKNFYGKR